MVDRTILGERGGQYGLWVSKPGKDVNTATDADMMISPTKRSLQVLDDFTVTWPRVYRPGDGSLWVHRHVSHPDHGFLPMVDLSIVSQEFTTSPTRPDLQAIIRRPFNRTTSGFFVGWQTVYSGSAADPVRYNPAVTFRVRLFAIEDNGGRTIVTRHYNQWNDTIGTVIVEYP